MNKILSKYLIFSLLILTIFQTQAKNYYVSKTGSDSNDGSENGPFFRIAKASSLLTAGDTCFIMAGTYREVLQPANNGAASNPIVYKNFQNDSVLISATEIVENWELHNGTIYKASVTMNLSRQNMVFCNGEAMDWARWPNNTDNDKYTVEGASVSGGSSSTIESPAIDGTNWNDG